jgi:TRAP-type C4-dicarboxylate transport system substrate-binding protein
VAVDGALPTFYTDVKTGVSDGAMTVATGVLGVKLYEVTPFINQMNMGTFYAGALAINKDTYNKLPPEVQKVVREVGREYTAKVSEGVDRALQVAYKVFKEQTNPPVVIVELPAEERIAMFRAMPNIAEGWVKANEARGLPARQVLNQYMDLMRKRGAKPARDWDKQ